jgi:hypothetical protein
LILKRRHLDQERMLAGGPKCGIPEKVSIDLADAGFHLRYLGANGPDFIVNLLIGHGGSPG